MTHFMRRIDGPNVSILYHYWPPTVEVQCIAESDLLTRAVWLCLASVLDRSALPALRGAIDSCSTAVVPRNAAKPRKITSYEPKLERLALAIQYQARELINPRASHLEQASNMGDAGLSSRWQRERGTRPVRIANCSGARGDPGWQMRRQATEGPIDFITGDYLAEMNLAENAEKMAVGQHDGWEPTAWDGIEQTLGTPAAKPAEHAYNANEGDRCAQ